MTDEIMTFDEILADPTYKAEFDRRVTKALSTVQAKLNAEVEKNKKFEAAADGETIESLQNKLKELQGKYDKETEAYKAQLAQRDYQTAIDKAIADSGVKFSSKSAEKAFRAGIGDSKLEMKDGALDGFDKYLEKAKSEDPSAFVKAGARVDTQGSLEGGTRETKPTSLLGALHEKYDK
mgnify:FL=1|nr:MAG TPA: minor structural protein [Caudoviricetes sp.]